MCVFVTKLYCEYLIFSSGLCAAAKAEAAQLQFLLLEAEEVARRKYEEAM